MYTQNIILKKKPFPQFAKLCENISSLRRYLKFWKDKYFQRTSPDIVSWAHEPQGESLMCLIVHIKSPLASTSALKGIAIAIDRGIKGALNNNRRAASRHLLKEDARPLLSITALSKTTSNASSGGGPSQN